MENDPLKNRVESLSLADPAGPGDLPPEDLDAWIDRLADGEVPEPQRRALLARLERSPGGWRHCALAFLEAQAWREALEPGALAAAADAMADDQKSNADDARFRVATPNVPTPTVATTGMFSQPAGRSIARRRLPWQAGPWLGMVAAAASFVVAFALGLFIQRNWLSPSLPDGTGAGTLAGTRGAIPEPAFPGGKTSPQGTSPQGTVQFVVNGPGGLPQQVEWPVEESADPAQWLREQPPAIPEDVAQELRRRGHHVHTERRYLPIPLDDGRSTVFPVDQVDVRLRGGNGYQ